MTLNVTELIETRETTHGDYADTARMSQHMKKLFRQENQARKLRGQLQLTDTQLEALDLIAVKIGRVFAGNCDHQDHWDDIAGYAHIANRQTTTGA